MPLLMCPFATNKLKLIIGILINTSNWLVIPFLKIFLIKNWGIMYQLKITKNTERLALQHFNNVKGRLLIDIHHFLSGNYRTLRKETISIHGDKPSEDLLRYLSVEKNLKELIVSHPDKLRDIISKLHSDAFDPKKNLNRILYHIFIIFGYEDKRFNKDVFYRQSQVGTCPYCNMMPSIAFRGFCITSFSIGCLKI